MKTVLATFLTLSIVFSSFGRDIDKSAALKALQGVKVDHTFSNGNKVESDIVSKLLEESFHTEFRIITPNEFKKKRFEKNYTVHGDQGTLRRIDHDLIEVTHDTGFIGGFIAYLEEKSHKVILIQIAPEG